MTNFNQKVLQIYNKFRLEYFSTLKNCRKIKFTVEKFKIFDNRCLLAQLSHLISPFSCCAEQSRFSSAGAMTFFLQADLPSYQVRGWKRSRTFACMTAKLQKDFLYKSNLHFEFEQKFKIPLLILNDLQNR